MKYLKMLGLAAVAAAALMALAGTGAASATVLCQTETSPCTQRWTKGTQVEFSVTSGTSATWITGIDTNTCTGGTLKGTVSNEGSSSETVHISIGAGSEFVWTNCTFNNQTVEGGELEVHAISGSTTGTLTMKGFTFTTSTPTYGSCSYTAGSGVHLGTLTPSATGAAVIDIEVKLTKNGGGFTCPTTMEWWEKWVQTAPKGQALYVEPS